MNIDNLPKTRFHLILIKIARLVFKNIINLKTTRKLFSVFLILTSLTLSGCVQYDLGINFNHTNNGEVVQHIKLPETVISFSGDYISEWSKTLERRARKLSGSVKHPLPMERNYKKNLVVFSTIPLLQKMIKLAIIQNYQI
jgi:hypothetical protein